MSIVTGRKEVAAGGTPERLSSSQWVKEIDIQAAVDNTGDVIIGNSSIVAAEATRVGITLDPGEVKTYHNVDLSNIWVDVTVNGDGVVYDGSY